MSCASRFGSLGRLACCLERVTLFPLETMAQLTDIIDKVSLHSEIHSINSLATAHTQKVYFSSPAHYYGKDFGHTAEGHPWHDVWAQLTGTTISIKKVGAVSQKGKEVPPLYVNVTDFVRLPFHLHRLRDPVKLLSLGHPRRQSRTPYYDDPSLQFW